MRALPALALAGVSLVTASAVTFFSVDAAAQDKSDSAASPDVSPSASPGASKDASKADGATPAKETVEPPPVQAMDSTDVTEKPGKTYYFVGLRYRGDVVPQFLMNLFVDGGKTVYSNAVGLELDMRKDNFSFIPALSYVEYGTGDILFLEKGKDAGLAGNWSNVNSSLKSIYLTADLLWSIKVHKNFDFEFGAGFGLGVLFGSLETSWVYQDPNGQYTASSGARYSPCLTGNTQPGCNTTDHQNASVSKINHYTEPFWTGGGSTPNFFPHISFPQFGLRVKAIKELEARLGLGFSLTGFWFGLSGDFGLEKVLDKNSSPTPHDNPK